MVPEPSTRPYEPHHFASVGPLLLHLRFRLLVRGRSPGTDVKAFMFSTLAREHGEDRSYALELPSRRSKLLRYRKCSGAAWLQYEAPGSHVGVFPWLHPASSMPPQ